MYPLVEESVLDSVVVRRGGGGIDFLTDADVSAGSESERRILRSFLAMLSWQELDFIAEGVAAGASRSTDSRSVAFGELDDEGRPVVLIEVADRILALEPRAFDRLFSKLLSVAIGGAVADRDGVTTAGWWPGLLESARIIRERAGLEA